jgi:2-polyprenyl-3-methyl-5-hydroxy-6-metoxy-1,4-benzoquinol methylase
MQNGRAVHRHSTFRIVNSAFRPVPQHLDPSVLATGDYARKQLFSRSRLVAFSHGARFRLARSLVEPFAGRRLLDYGCGDGTFLALVHDLFRAATGADVDPAQTSQCIQRFAAVGGLRFILTEQLRRDPAGSFDVVTCMEVLEHCPDAERAAVIEDLRRAVTVDGRVIVSVPIEIGPSLIAKHLFRIVAGWRRLGDYRYHERLTVVELARMFVAGRHSAIGRPIYTAEFSGGIVMRYHGHKGFNWRQLRGELSRSFVVERTLFSPVPLLGSLLNSQVWMVCRRRP